MERNWVSDLMLLQIENIPAGHNEVTAMHKHLEKNNPAVTPQPTKLPFPDHPATQIKAFSLHHVCLQLQVESTFCEEFPEQNIYSKYTQK